MNSAIITPRAGAEREAGGAVGGAEQMMKFSFSLLFSTAPAKLDIRCGAKKFPLHRL